MKIPKTIGEAADLLYVTKEKRLAKQKEVETLKEEQLALEAYIIQNLPKSKASGVAGKKARVSVHTDPIPQIKDWNKFYKYVHKHKAFDLIQRRISEKAVEARLDDGEKVPGIEIFNVTKVSINKVK
jgi:hypothetical protein